MTKTIAAAALASLIGCTVAGAQTITRQTTTTTETTTISGAPDGTSECLYTGRVFRLDPYGDNNLSVRDRPYGPRGPANEKDELFTNDQVCVMRTAGQWLFVQYERGGRMFSGWVFDRYIRED
jgi:hypothetical protein